MDDVEVDLVHAEALEAPLGLSLGVTGARVELRRDEDLLARDTTFPDPDPDALLVPVRLSRVDVAVAELERPADGVDALRGRAGGFRFRRRACEYALSWSWALLARALPPPRSGNNLINFTSSP